ncbi:hypothetical protein ACP4OV_005003 [Aristida adscensionis]
MGRPVSPSIFQKQVFKMDECNQDGRGMKKQSKERDKGAYSILLNRQISTLK